MSLDTPTTAEINANIIAQMEAALNQTIPLAPKAFNRVLAKALAGVFILLYKYGGSIFQNIFVQTASAVDTMVLGVTVNPLTFWGRLIGAGDRIAATNAELVIDVTVTNQTGSLPSGSQLVNADNGVTYITLGSVLLDAATVSPTIRAVADQAGGGGAGVLGNLQINDEVSFANPLANVSRVAIVSSQVVTGADAETVEAYRQRIIDLFQKRPQGGAYADYNIWGNGVAGIANTYPYTSDCPGQVDVYVESATEVDGIPTGAQLQEVLDAIELDDAGLATRRPANALANTFSIIRLSFDVEVINLTVDNPASVQSTIVSAVEEFFLDREPFIVGLSIPPRLDRITESGVAGVVDDIVSAAGGIFTGVTIKLLMVDTPIYTLGIGEKAKADSVTFV